MHEDFVEHMNRGHTDYEHLTRRGTQNIEKFISEAKNDPHSQTVLLTERFGFSKGSTIRHSGVKISAHARDIRLFGKARFLEQESKAWQSRETRAFANSMSSLPSAAALGGPECRKPGKKARSVGSRLHFSEAGDRAAGQPYPELPELPSYLWGLVARPGHNPLNVD